MRIESIIAGIFGLIVGAAIGGSTGYFWSEAKFRKRSDAEYSKYAEFMKRKKEEAEGVQAGSGKDEPKEEKKEETTTTVDESVETYRDISSVYADPQQRKENEPVNYSGYSAHKAETKPEDLSPKEMDGIIKISEEQYDNEYIGRYSKTPVVYYVKSHEIYDEDENPLDIDSVCGYEFLSTFPDGGHLFVRNTHTETDYDIEFLNEEYYHWQ